MTETAAAKIEREKQFHNKWAKSIRLEELLVREAFEAPTAIENRFALDQLGDLKGKKILDLGCGAGESSVYLALCGADVHACDIADEFLRVAEALAEKFRVRVNLAQADTAHLPYPDRTFDCVFANGVLHHVDLEPTAKEISRVLKIGGKAVMIEPLPYNPVINVYRKMASAVRTEDERPLRWGQIQNMAAHFKTLEHREFWLFSLLIFLHFYFVRRWDPSKVRYWKKVIEEGKAYQKPFGCLQKIDRFALNALPFLRLLCWNTVIVATR